MRILGLKPGSVLSGWISDICHEWGIEKESSCAICYMAAQMPKIYHCGLFYGVQERFRPMNVGIIMPQGLHNTEKHIWKPQYLEDYSFWDRTVVDHRECSRRKRWAREGWKTFVLSMTQTLLPCLISSYQCEVIDLSSEKTYAQSKAGEGDGCIWLVKGRLGGLWVLRKS